VALFEVKNAWSYTPTVSYVFLTSLVIKHGENFAYTLGLGSGGLKRTTENLKIDGHSPRFVLVTVESLVL
jgi:hypothetical protein